MQLPLQGREQSREGHSDTAWSKLAELLSDKQQDTHEARSPLVGNASAKLMHFSRHMPSHRHLQPPQLAGSLLLLRGMVVGGFPAGKSTHSHQSSREDKSRDS